MNAAVLNYRQLHYFWVVAKTGRIVRACEQLNLTPQTIGGQISLLEQTFGIALFQRVGRQLELTEAGRQALPYAEQMFRPAMNWKLCCARNPTSSRFGPRRGGGCGAQPSSSADRPPHGTQRPAAHYLPRRQTRSLLADRRSSAWTW